jgi:hypothetical protein
MQTALENTHYKKIWEKVIMNKHPEAKSLEEALEAESKECFCLFDDGVNSCEIHLMNTIKEFITLPMQIEDILIKQRKILGRPITLEDILILFGKTFNETLNGFKFVQLTCEGAFITMKPIEHPLHRIEVILGKPLHEQTPETWEKISNLI